VYFELKQDILDTIEDINDLFTVYESLFETIKQNEPNKIELAALATIFHSFYNGVENIFLLVSKQIDNDTPIGSTWHQSLLNQMIQITGDRTQIISPDTASALAPYLKFRHFFRHAYAFVLDWKRIKPLADDLTSVWNSIKKDIVTFCDTCG